MARFNLQHFDQQMPVVDVETGRLTDYGLRMLFGNTENAEDTEDELTTSIEELTTTVNNLSLDDLSDVDTATTPPTDGQALVWVEDDEEWAPGDVAAAGSGGGPSDGANTFHATSNLTTANVTGDGTVYRVPFNTVAQARGFVTFNTATGVATITEPGTYIVEGSHRLDGGGTHDWSTGQIYKNGVSIVNRGQEFTDETVVAPQVVTVIDCAAGDTLDFRVQIGGSTLTMDLSNAAGAQQNFFKITKLSIGGGGGAFRGARVHKAANQVGANYTVEASVAWDSETNGYDVGGWHDNVTNNTRLTVPAGVTRVRVLGQLTMINVSATDEFYAHLSKNGAFLFGGPETIGLADASATAPRINMVSSVIDVVPGDYFEFRLRLASDTSIDIIANESWFAIEAVEVINTVAGRGALVKKAADQVGADYTTSTAVAWDAEVYDDLAIHSNVTNNSRLTVPSGVSRVRLSAQIVLANVTADVWTALFIQKNGASFFGRGQAHNEVGLTTPTIFAQSAIVEVVPGDFFTVLFQVETDAAVDISSANSWFAMEVLA